MESLFNFRFQKSLQQLEHPKVIRETRKNSYGDIGDQLDMLYKDMLAGKLDATGEWHKAIKAVKDANPKP